MDKTSSVVTGGVTVSAATLVPLVTWALAGFPQPIPDSVPYLIAATIVTGGHALYNLVATRSIGQPPEVEPPKTTAV